MYTRTNSRVRTSFGNDVEAEEDVYWVCIARKHRGLHAFDAKNVKYPPMPADDLKGLGTRLATKTGQGGASLHEALLLVENNKKGFLFFVWTESRGRYWLVALDANLDAF